MRIYRPPAIQRYRKPHPPPIRRRLPKKTHAERIRALRFLIAALILLFSILLADYKIRPIVKMMTTHQTNLICTQAINAAVTDALENSPFSYETLVTVSRSNGGTVSSIETNVIAVNRLKTEITQCLLTRLQGHAMQEMSIPLGTLLDSQFLTGRGPQIPFRVVPSSSARVSIESAFTAAGINQTLHQIILTVELDADAILPGVSADTHINTSFPVAETVIVGSIPGAYTSVYGDNSALPNKLSDYSAYSP